MSATKEPSSIGAAKGSQGTKACSRPEVREVRQGVWEWRGRPWGWNEWSIFLLMAVLVQIPVLMSAIKPRPAGAFPLWLGSLMFLGFAMVLPGMILLLTPRRAQLDEYGFTITYLLGRRRFRASQVLGVSCSAPPTPGLALTLHGLRRDRKALFFPPARATRFAAAGLDRFGMHPRLEEFIRRSADGRALEWPGRVGRVSYYVWSAAWVVAGLIVIAGYREYIWPVLISTGSWLAMFGLVLSLGVAAIGCLRVRSLVAEGPPTLLRIDSEGILIRHARSELRIATADVVGIALSGTPEPVHVWYRAGEQLRSKPLHARWFRCEPFELTGALLGRFGIVWPGAWCGQCGYDLRGTSEGRCPECGVSLREPLKTTQAAKRPRAVPAFAAYYHSVVRRSPPSARSVAQGG